VATLGKGTKSVIKFNDLAFDPRFKGAIVAMGLPANTDPLDAMSVEVLHETSHATGKFSHERYKSGQEEIHPWKQNQKILDTCFPRKK
jgi:hypothetical protein